MDRLKLSVSFNLAENRCRKCRSVMCLCMFIFNIRKTLETLSGVVHVWLQLNAVVVLGSAANAYFMKCDRGSIEWCTSIRGTLNWIWNDHAWCQGVMFFMSERVSQSSQRLEKLQWEGGKTVIQSYLTKDFLEMIILAKIQVLMPVF